MKRAVIVVFNEDLRLEDNHAWALAVESGHPVIPVWIKAFEEEAPWAPGEASCWWLHGALASLREALNEQGLQLILRQGPSKLKALEALVEESGAQALYWTRCYNPEAIKRDQAIKTFFGKKGVEVISTNSRLWAEPFAIEKADGGPFKVFTPFWKKLQQSGWPEPILAPRRPQAPPQWPQSLQLDALKLLPQNPWHKKLEAYWDPTLKGAHQALDVFLKNSLEGYSVNRDIPSVEGVSRLSPYLRWGQLGPRQILKALAPYRSNPQTEVFVRQLAWREFAYHLLYHFPTTPTEPLYPKFKNFPAEPDPVLDEVWRQGRTGYPFVDAGMRELWETGWMHNRLRMVTASVWVKHFLQPWLSGARFFWDTLVDADLANNTLGWQWAAGCGADAAPYFRVFNPFLQSERFDPKALYIKRWLPELRGLLPSDCHKPLSHLGNYPHPLISHQAGRARALAAWEALKE